MADFINTIAKLGDDAVTDGLIDRSITEFKDDTVRTLPGRAFSGCSALKEVDLPIVTSVGWYAFSGCSSVETIKLRALNSFFREMFDGCAVRKLYGPNCTTIPTNGLRGLSNLEHVDLTAVTSIGDYSMSGTNVKTLVLRNTSQVVTLSSTLAFHYITGSSGIGQGTGRIFVPRTMVESYKTASVWSTYADQIRAIEDFSVDGTINGEVGWCAIHNSLTNVENSNNATESGQQRSYSAILTSSIDNPISAVTITMGGVDVTENVYDAETGVIQIDNVTGDIIIVAAAMPDILCPLVNGELYNSVSDMTLKVSNGNHVEVVVGSVALTGSHSGLINISDLSKNASDVSWGSNAGSVNNQDAIFTIPAGSTAILSVRNLITSSGLTAGQVSINVRKANASASAFTAIDIRLPATETEWSRTYTATEDVDISAAIMYVSNIPANSNFSFDVGLVVDGVNYI